MLIPTPTSVAGSPAGIHHVLPWTMIQVDRRSEGNPPAQKCTGLRGYFGLEEGRWFGWSEKRNRSKVKQVDPEREE